MKSLIITTVIFFSFAFKLSAQDIKTYSGDYNEIGIDGEKGVATYEYYENDKFERIYHGKFLYDGEIRMQGWSKPAFKVSGRFYNDKKDGIWEYKVGDKDLIDDLSFIYAKGRYNKGLMVGEWQIVEKRKPIKGDIVKIFNSAVFVENKPVKIDFSGMSTKMTVKGQLDSLFFVDGKWEIKFSERSDFEDVRKFRHGVLFFRLKRNIQTGEVLVHFDSSNFVNDFFKNYNRDKNLSIVNGKKYALKSFRTDNKDDVIASAILYWDSKTHSLDNINIVYKFKKGHESIKFDFYNEIIDYYKTENGKKELQEQRRLEKQEKIFKANIDEADTYAKMKNFDLAIKYYEYALKIKNDQQVLGKLQLAENEKAKQLAEEERKKKLRDDVRRIDKEVTQKNSEIYKLYHKYSPLTSKTKKIKPEIYDAYARIYIDRNVKEDFEETFKRLTALKSIQEKMVKLIDIKTKKIENDLEGLTDYNKILESFQQIIVE